MTDTMAQPWTPQLRSICEFSCSGCVDKLCWLEGDYQPCDGCIATMHRHDASTDMLEALSAFDAMFDRARGKYTEGHIDSLPDDHVIFGWGDSDNNLTLGLFRKCRAALAKARGQS